MTSKVRRKIMNPREQACMLALLASQLSSLKINTILAVWCKKMGLSLEEFFEAEPQQWGKACRLEEKDVQRLQQARETLTAQAFLLEQLQHNNIAMLTLLDSAYPRLLKELRDAKQKQDLTQLPPALFYAGDLTILSRQTIAVIGSRNASATSLAFTRATSAYLASQGANIISGFARGVDKTAYEGATSTAQGYTTIVLPHGIRKLSKAQIRELQPRIEAGHVLLLSQFYPNDAWTVGRAMERNKVVVGLAQSVIVAEADIKGGTWDGAKRALQQNRTLYVREVKDDNSLPGNARLLTMGAVPLSWPGDDLWREMNVILHEGQRMCESQQMMTEAPQAEQLRLIS
jgi:DNA protecting protein DprA